MLFNAPEFIFVFLPLVLLVFFSLAYFAGNRPAILSLILGSLIFYGWWSPKHLSLLLISILINYYLGAQIFNQKTKGQKNKAFLVGGIVFNLLLLGYFKYTHFLLDNLNDFFQNDILVPQIVLPLAISFFTFQQIAYLVDVYQGKVHEQNFVNYCLFVSFFPQLIAGPIVHHSEMLPQFSRTKKFRPKLSNLLVGSTIFFIGLFKKTVLADGVATFASPVFSAALQGESLGFAEAWAGTLSYTFQLYFDFSGYSDMAIGLGRMFGIYIPQNFNSPYKAQSIIDFWRRWHITLSRFLRDYLYIPLGGNRHGPSRRQVNIFITMLLGGIWHGAGWTFAAWGALHGFYIAMNHSFRQIQSRFGLKITHWFARLSAQTVTFISVMVAWVFFRAENLDSAFQVLKGMCGVNGIALPLKISRTLGPNITSALESIGIDLIDAPYFYGNTQILSFAVLFCITFFMPNTQDLMNRYHKTFQTYSSQVSHSSVSWRLNLISAVLMAFITVTSLFSLQRVSEFIYFQF